MMAVGRCLSSRICSLGQHNDRHSDDDRRIIDGNNGVYACVYMCVQSCQFLRAWSIQAISERFIISVVLFQGIFRDVFLTKWTIFFDEFSTEFPDNGS